MRDGLLRRGLKALARAYYYANLWPTRWLLRAKGEPRFELGGACRLCAKCCEAPSIQVHPFVFRLKSLRSIYLAWQRRVNQFALVESDPKTKVFVFRCGHFDWETRRCDSYASRPAMCRDYPRNLLYHPMPDLLPGCGYVALSKSRDRVAEMLAKEAIAPEKRAAIEKAFYLEAAQESMVEGEAEDRRDERVDSSDEP
jgi:Fe-S-cluster containining protein